MGLGLKATEPYTTFHHVITNAGERTAELGERILGFKMRLTCNRL